MHPPTQPLVLVQPRPPEQEARRVRSRLSGVVPLEAPNGNEPLRADRSVGPAVIEVNGGCGALICYKAAGNVELRRYVNPVLSIANSSGGIASALLQAGADEQAILSMVAGAPVLSFIQDTERRRWSPLRYSPGHAVEKWLHQWLDRYGHGTWSAYRFSEPVPGLGDWTHRFNVMVCAFIVRGKVGRELADKRDDLSRASFLQLVRRHILENGGVSLRELIIPQDLGAGPGKVLPWLAERIDEESPAQWIVNSARHPGLFKPCVIPAPQDLARRHGDFSIVIIDGATLSKHRSSCMPLPFRRDELSPYPVVAFEMGLDHAHFRSEHRYMNVRQRDLSTFPHMLVARGGYPDRRSIHFEDFDSDELLKMYAAGMGRAEQVFPAYLGPYLEHHWRARRVVGDLSDLTYRGTEGIMDIVSGNVKLAVSLLTRPGIKDQPVGFASDRTDTVGALDMPLPNLI